jgi:hypothetical protein
MEVPAMRHVVLLGDSIFDNAGYVPGKPPVIEQLRSRLAGEWEATLLAVDGHVTVDVIRQTARLPKDASHLVVSCGGNDALGFSNILNEKANSVAEVLQRFAEIRSDFQRNFRNMLTHVLRLGKPTAVCTIYDTVPGYEPWALAALAMFNEIILREAFSVKVPVVDLRLTFTEPADYSALSPIEPSAAGGEKITQAICRLLNNHDYSKKYSAVYV